MSAILSESAILLDLSPVIDMTDEQFYDFCQANSDLFIERNADGEILIMTPEGAYTANRNSALNSELYVWTRKDGTGMAFGPTAGFILPNRAMRSPDAAWVQLSRIEAFTEEQRERFLPLCPDFVIELRSRTDQLSLLQDKMREYMENGVRLGWLIDPQDRSVYIYRPSKPVQHLQYPESVSGDPELPGFRLELGPIWKPGS
jgi:Uma2 family endonuclease